MSSRNTTATSRSSLLRLHQIFSDGVIPLRRSTVASMAASRSISSPSSTRLTFRKLSGTTISN